MTPFEKPFGTVQEIARDTWKAEGFQGVQSTTRLVRLTLKKGTTRESLPHQVRLFSGNALVVVPGRAPLCLRCKRTGHVRKDCRVPRCEDCRRYGHLKEDCVKTYAVAVAAATEDAEAEMMMDEAEAGLAATDNIADTAVTVTETTPPVAPEQADLSEGGPTEATTAVEEPVPVVPVVEQPNTSKLSKE